MKSNLQKETLPQSSLTLTNSYYIGADPCKVAAAINSRFPLIEGNVVSPDTVRRRYKDKTIAEVGSQTHVDSIYCFTNSMGHCDLAGHDGLAYHLGQNWSDRYSTNPDSLLKQAKRLTKRKKFPGYRLFWSGCWLFSSSEVDSYLSP